MNPDRNKLYAGAAIGLVLAALAREQVTALRRLTV